MQVINQNEKLVKADNQDTPKLDPQMHEVFQDGARWMRDKMLKMGFVKVVINKERGDASMTQPFSENELKQRGFGE